MSTFKTITPVDGSVYIEREYATDADIDTALQQARQAQRNWCSTRISERAAICSRAIDSFIDNKDEIARELTWQMGRPIAFAAGEVGGLEERARYMISVAEQSLSRRVDRAQAGLRSLHQARTGWGGIRRRSLELSLSHFRQCHRPGSAGRQRGDPETFGADPAVRRALCASFHRSRFARGGVSVSAHHPRCSPAYNPVQ